MALPTLEASQPIAAEATIMTKTRVNATIFADWYFGFDVIGLNCGRCGNMLSYDDNEKNENGDVLVSKYISWLHFSAPLKPLGFVIAIKWIEAAASRIT
jgi:hypothetical protein